MGLHRNELPWLQVAVVTKEKQDGLEWFKAVGVFVCSVFLPGRGDPIVFWKMKSEESKLGEIKKTSAEKTCQKQTRKKKSFEIKK